MVSNRHRLQLAGPYRRIRPTFARFAELAARIQSVSHSLCLYTLWSGSFGRGPSMGRQKEMCGKKGETQQAPLPSWSWGICTWSRHIHVLEEEKKEEEEEEEEGKEEDNTLPSRGRPQESGPTDCGPCLKLGGHTTPATLILAIDSRKRVSPS